MTPQVQAALAAMKSTDLYALARARALLTVYDEVWSATFAQYKILEAEVEFQFPLLNPETESASRTFDEAGKIDALAEHKATGSLVVFEHKTSSEDIAPDSKFWDRVRLNSQISKYHLAAMRMGKSVRGIIYDVIGKPAHRPCQIPTLDAQGFKIVLDPQGNRVFTKDGKKPRETGDTEKGWVVQGRLETPEEFETRLLTVLRAEPGSYFAQREVPRLDSDILQFMVNDWNYGQQILYFRKMNNWPQNDDACAQFGNCEMLDLCCGRASVDGIRYGKREKVHAELKVQSGDSGKELLTNSRVRTLRRCARLHFLKYEQGVERIGEESEALSFGTLVHVGLESYFLKLKEVAR